MKKTTEEKIKELQPKIEHIWEQQWGTTDEGYICKQTMDLLLSEIRFALLSQHTEDMRRVKEAIPEKLTDPTATWGEVGNAGWNACRQEVLTKIGGI